MGEGGDDSQRAPPISQLLLGLVSPSSVLLCAGLFKLPRCPGEAFPCLKHLLSRLGLLQVVLGRKKWCLIGAFMPVLCVVLWETLTMEALPQTSWTLRTLVAQEGIRLAEGRRQLGG